MTHAMNPENLGLLKKTLDSLPDGVLVVSPERKIVYANDRFVAMWGIPSTVMGTHDDSKILDYVEAHVTDLETFRKQVEDLYETRRETEDEIHLTDGRVFLRRGTYHVNAEGETAHIWVFSDITSLKAFERCSLTGVFNRRKFDEEFGLRLLGMKDKDIIGVALLDLDNFKQYNDSYGHQQGDRLLSEVGRLFLGRLRRRGDTAYRIGGEEFLLVCKCRTEQHLFDFIDSIRADVQRLGREHKKNAPYNVVTFSAGVGFIQGSAKADYVFAQVDKALYAAKEKGRNQLVRAKI